MNILLTDPFSLTQDFPEINTGSVRSGHSTVVRFNRRGDYLAAGRTDGTVAIFDMDTLGVACKLKGHTRQIQSLSWSRDGRYLLTSSQDWKCILWDLQTGSILKSVRFEGPIYIAELHPFDHLKFLVALFEEQPMLIDVSGESTIKLGLPSAPKRQDQEEGASEKQAAQDAKQTTTVAIFTASGEHIMAGTNKGWFNVIEVATRETIYSTKLCAGVIILLRLTNSGRDLVVNASDRTVRTVLLPNFSAPDLDPDTLDIDTEHRFQDKVNRLSYNHCAFSSTGEYVTASTYNNHDIYIWERGHGSLVKILEGPKEEHGVVEWHPTRPFIVACGLESGRIRIWSIVPQQRWAALAPDFVEVEENVEYEEQEDEFDIHPQEEIHKRRLDLEDEDVDVYTIEPVRGAMVDDAAAFRMPVDYEFHDSDGEEELVSIGRGEMRRKSPGEKDYGLDGDVIEGEYRRKKSKSKRR